MEAVGFAAGVAGLIQITGQVTVFASGYIGKVKRASEEINSLVSELTSLSVVVKKLEHLGDKYPPNSTDLQKLDISLRECDIKLQELRLKLENGMKGSRLRKAFRSLKWPLEEAETTQFMAYIERRKSLFLIALSIDTFTISQSIEGQVVAVDKSVKDIQNKIQVVSEAQNDEKISRDKIKRGKALNWLYPDDFEKKHIDISNRRKKGTGEWFFNSKKVQNWISGSHSSRLLWGYGIPGAGKTYISCGVIDHLTKQAGASDGIAYIYFDYKERDDQTPTRVLESLVKQLGYQIPYLPQKISTLYDEFGKRGKRPTMEELIIVLLSLFTSFNRVFIVFDALDECNQSGQRNKLLPLFHSLGEGGANIFITSRHHPEDIQASFKDIPQIEIAASGQDIKSYVLQELRENPRAKRLAEQGGCEDRIISELTERAKGMFLVVRFHVEYLCQQTTVKQLLSALESFGTKDSYTDKSPLDPTYDRVLETIRLQPRRLSELAIKTLSWVVKAQRALTVEEIQIAVSIDLESRSLDELDFPDKATLIEVCAGLITIDEGNIIRLAHLTVQEYLLRSTALLPEMDYEIAATCMTYLSLDICIIPAIPLEDIYEGPLPKDYTFQEYVVRYLVHHLKHSDEARTMPHILEFLRLREKTLYWVSWAFQLLNSWGQAPVQQWSEFLDDGDTLLYVAVCMGNCLVVQRLLDEGFNILSLGEGKAFLNLDTKYNSTALHLAVICGCVKMVKLLLDHGAGISAKNDRGHTPLHTAAIYGNEGVVKLLLDHGTDISTRNNSGVTPLHTAVAYGREEIAKLFLDHGADISTKDKVGDTPLHTAVIVGREEVHVVKLLLDHGADISAKNDRGHTPLHTAVIYRHEGVVKLFLDHGADISTKNNSGNTPLHAAAIRGHENIAKLLLGADISAEDNNGDILLDKMPALRDYVPAQPSPKPEQTLHPRRRPPPRTPQSPTTSELSIH